SLKTSIKTITNLSDSNCLEIQGASLLAFHRLKQFSFLWWLTGLFFHVSIPEEKSQSKHS
ncbi:hypothetical protein, partial [Serratia marcescens]|uniref:hypothetical protein n=1 Tax=Serratia marcescens TaxID=615 RepID=UPI0025AAD2B5